MRVRGAERDSLFREIRETAESRRADQAHVNVEPASFDVASSFNMSTHSGTATSSAPHVYRSSASTVWRDQPPVQSSRNRSNPATTVFG